MSIPTASDLARMQAEAVLIMPDTCTVTDPGSVTTTDSGGTTISGPSSVTDVACRLSRTGTQADLVQFGAQITAEADYSLVLEHGTVIEAGWSVTMTSGALVGLTLSVLAVAKAGSWGSAVRAAVIESDAIGG